MKEAVSESANNSTSDAEKTSDIESDDDSDFEGKTYMLCNSCYIMIIFIYLNSIESISKNLLVSKFFSFTNKYVMLIFLKNKEINE